MIIHARPKLPTSLRPVPSGMAPAPAPVINPHGTGSYYVPSPGAPKPAERMVPYDPAIQPATPQQTTRYGAGGDAGDYVKYNIGASRWAAELRAAFDVVGASGWQLASEIVPVYVLNEAGGAEGEAPFSQGQSTVVPAAGHRAVAGIFNGSSKNVRIDRVKMKTASTAMHYRVTKRGGRPTMGANSFEEGIIFMGAPIDIAPGVILEYGTIAVANIHTAGNAIIGHSGGATLHDEAFPRALLYPGEGYYVYANLDAVANLLVQFEGVQLTA